MSHLVQWREQAPGAGAGAEAEAGMTSASPAPLDPATYPQYQLPQPRPDLAAYHQLLGAGASTSAGLPSPGGERRT